MRTRRFWPRWVIATMVALGLSVAWAYAALFLLSMSSGGSSYLTLQERVYVDGTGRPLILRSSWDSVSTYQSALSRESFFTLDRKAALEPERTIRMSEIYPALLTVTRRAAWAPQDWMARLSRLNDGRDFPGSATWYVVTEAAGKRYLEGYDDATRRRVGYIGRRGYAPAIPAPEDRFDANAAEGYRLSPEGTGLNGAGYALMEGAVDPWKAYLVDGESVVEVDVRERAVQTVVDGVRVRAFGLITRVAEDGPGVEEGVSEFNPPTEQLLVLRLADRIVYVDPRTQAREDFVLPGRVAAERSLGVHGLAGDEIMIQLGIIHGWERREVALMRINRQGDVLSEQTVELDGSEPASMRTLSFQALLIGVHSIAWATVIGVAAPVGEYMDGNATSYGAAVSGMVREVWPALVIVAVVAIACGWIVSRWQRRHGRSHTAWWVVGALLIGPAFLVAYWAEHRGQARGAEKLRDAGAPAVPRLGTEVFA